MVDSHIRANTRLQSITVQTIDPIQQVALVGRLRVFLLTRK